MSDCCRARVPLNAATHLASEFIRNENAITRTRMTGLPAQCSPVGDFKRLAA